MNGRNLDMMIGKAEEWKAFLGDLCDLAKKLRVKDEMKFMATSWGRVTTETIPRCFKACDFDILCVSLPEETEN